MSDGIYPIDKVTLSEAHPHWCVEAGERDDGQQLWLRGRSLEACYKKLTEMKQDDKYKNIFAHYCGVRPAHGIPVPEHSFELLVNLSDERAKAMNYYWWRYIKT